MRAAADFIYQSGKLNIIHYLTHSQTLLSAAVLALWLNERRTPSIKRPIPHSDTVAAAAAAAKET